MSQAESVNIDSTFFTFDPAFAIFHIDVSKVPQDFDAGCTDFLFCHRHGEKVHMAYDSAVIDYTDPTCMPRAWMFFPTDDQFEFAICIWNR